MGRAQEPRGRERSNVGLLGNQSRLNMCSSSVSAFPYSTTSGDPSSSSFDLPDETVLREKSTATVN